MTVHTETSSVTDTTVGQLVTERPSRARVFEKFGIDYCCGGKKPLGQACLDRKVDPQVVLGELRKSDEHRSPERDWAALGLTRLADHIEQVHHGFLRHELPRLDFLTGKVAAVHGKNHPGLIRLREVFVAFKAEMLDHMQKEESVVFPLCRRIEAGAAAGAAGLDRPLDVLTHEHEHAGQALEAMRRLTDDYTAPPDACNTYRAMLDALKELEADMHQHVHLENNVLFPAARRARAG
jgi:regulator of cell morphogenesis and NO signaling